MYCLIGFGLGVCLCVLVELWTHFCVYGCRTRGPRIMYFFPEEGETHDPECLCDMCGPKQQQEGLHDPECPLYGTGDETTVCGCIPF